MFIKNVFNVINYKGLENGFKVDFDDITYIVGDNAKNKTTIGSLPLWILTGYNIYGSNKEQVANDSIITSQNTVASMTIIDNEGSEHVITRCKGKDNFVMLDGIRTSQEILTRFYKDVHAFICSYYPNYFRSMDLAKQRELLLRILPAISSEDAFKLLEKEEQEILEQPIADIKGFCKSKRAEIKALNSELDKIAGSKNMLINTAIQKEENLKVFEKQKQLDNLEEKYEKLIENTDNIVTIEEIEKDINKLDNKISNNIKIELCELQTRQKKELENLDNVTSVTSTCPTCKQEIKNESLIKALKITYKKNINTIAEKIESLKKETQELMDKKKNKIEKYKVLKTPQMQEKTKIRDEIKQKIDILQKERSEIDLFNKEVELKHNEILNAKKQIEEFDKLSKKMSETIDKYNNQSCHLLHIQNFF